MAIYHKSSGLGGAWIDKKELADGAKVKILNETTPLERDFNGAPQTQQVCKIQISGGTEPKNIALNKPTINALIDSFGEDSKSWIGQTLTVHKERTTFGGKRGYAVYLLAEGYEVTEDENGYVVVQKIGLEKEFKSVDAASLANETSDEIDPSQIPF